MDETLVSLVWMVAALFLEEPPLRLADEMVAGDLELPVPPDADGDLAAGIEALREFARTCVGHDARQVHSALCQEFTALFVGPRPRTVHPYESVYRDSLAVGGQTFQRLLMGESVDRVRAFWSEAGLQPQNPRNYPPDHIGFELGFLAYVGQEFQETGEQRCLDLARRFLEEHVLPWVPTFCAELYALETACFYRGVAQLTNGLLAILAGQLELADRPQGDPSSAEV